MKGHRALTSLSLALLAVAGLNAQQRPAKGSGGGEGFKQFREKMLSDFNSFKQRILDQYADFLEGTWHPYEPLFEAPADTVPKPVKAPAVTPAKAPATPEPTLNPPTSPITPTPPTPTTPTTPTTSPSRPSPPTPPSPRTEKFDFYGMSLEMPQIDFRIMNRMSSDADRAEQFRELRKGAGPEVAAALGELASSLGLNGYLSLRLGEAYLRHLFPAADDASRFSALHYLLSELGYDVRLARGQRGTPVLLVPFEQKVASTFYLKFDGENYTSIIPDGMDLLTADIGQIYTCDLPSDRERGKKMNLRIEGLNLPYKPHHFDITGGNIHISGETNENLYKMLYRYPLMPMADFASSTLQPEVRKDVARQVREQLSGMPKDQAVNELLKFFHFGFDYATDTQNHGREKPYFIEETLYYDKNDCEDRAMMFTWLVWNALELPAHLNAYPGHESAAVAIDSESAGEYSYTFKGATYRNTDPTFLGSHIGQVMPQFSTTPPKIEKTYP